MQFAPEAQILILNSVILGMAYLAIYPGMAQKTLPRMIVIDMVLSALALTVVGALFWGTGVRFSLIVFNSHWVVFTIVTFMLMELPLFLRFAHKHGINLSDDPD
ncbi:hypothetical protein ACJ5NV_16530 [Loktanella agnita]|uniref:hypothetical protein n=1 Tax=Loktanella agnita TaxID=287097 RepID=UPI003989C3AE